MYLHDLGAVDPSRKVDVVYVHIEEDAATRFYEFKLNSAYSSRSQVWERTRKAYL
jgi:hypothetical protein